VPQDKIARLALQVVLMQGLPRSSWARGAIMGQQNCTPVQKSLYCKGFSLYKQKLNPIRLSLFKKSEETPFFFEKTLAIELHL
jgi:hypothetical protein